MIGEDGHHICIVNGTKSSESARILFVNHPEKGEIVLKQLLPYEDIRYQQKELSQRQAHQLEALIWNGKFTPDFYFGLAPICDNKKHELNERQICIGKINNPEQTHLEKNKEYVLCMKRLPYERRLDLVLNQADQSIEDMKLYLHRLMKHISVLHLTVAPPVPEGERSWWGSKEQLQQKLQENFDFLEPGITKRSGEHIIFQEIKMKLPEVLENTRFQAYLLTRRQELQIKRCHGDLKAPNIWIAPEGQNFENLPQKDICLLDTIDFNPGFCMIDLLSDLAMLVVDIHARTGLDQLADYLIDDYLHFSQGIDEETARNILAYYLVEKAIVGAAISYRFDKEPKLGDQYLDVASYRLSELV
jgi:aminoglycoside phosphotransferase family enzyme